MVELLIVSLIMLFAIINFVLVKSALYLAVKSTHEMPIFNCFFNNVNKITYSVYSIIGSKHWCYILNKHDANIKLLVCYLYYSQYSTSLFDLGIFVG
jgi:hypothetical protein